jgi:hypothetical protein
MNKTNHLIKEQNDLICKYCSKQFKRRSPKIKHEINQICVPKKLRTICVSCNLTFISHDKFKEHLISEQHIKNLLSSDNTEIIRERPITAIDIDPFLSTLEKNEIVKPSTNIILYKEENNGNITKQKFNLAEETNLEKEIKEEREEKEYLEELSNRNNPIIKGYSSYEELVRQEIYNRPIPTERQEEILCKLVDLNDELSDDKRDAFLDILKNMTEDDADFMTTYIRNCGGIELVSKQIYLELIDKFVRKLTQIYNQGYKKIGGKDIIIFISRLSK